MIVYLIENKQNSKRYVGITNRDFKRRWREHVSDAKHGCEYPLHRALRKYGETEFVFSVIDEANSHDELLEKEKYWISTLNTSEVGYNVTKGGEGSVGRVVSDEIKQKLSQATKNWWASATDEVKENHRIKGSLSHKNRDKSTYKAGPMSEETRKKMSLVGKGKKKPPFSDAHKKKISLGKMGQGTGEKNVMAKSEIREKQRLACIGRRKIVREDGTWFWGRN